MFQEELKDLKELEMEKRLYPAARNAETWPQAGLNSLLHSAGIRKYSHAKSVSSSAYCRDWPGAGEDRERTVQRKSLL